MVDSACRLRVRAAGTAWVWVVVMAIGWGASDAEGGEAAERIDFEGEVYPIFVEACLDCHGPRRQEGHLRLDAKAIVFAEGVSGPTVVPGDAEASVLYQRVAGMGDEEQMPLHEDPLPEAHIERIRQWIDAGAEWREGLGSAVSEIEPHWAYVPPERPALPEVQATHWPRNAIDYFVLARLEQEGLSPSEPSERARLIRRVYLDLIGLPPTVEEVDAFVADDRPDAWERVVDRLLGSPHYGERWAQRWLDLARYADSHGYQSDQLRQTWLYRDWVIEAINADMPFDRFTIEQLAGDLLEEPTVEQRVATGFQRQTTLNIEGGVDPEQSRVEQVIDRVNTLGTVWLGMTMECAQCHNHKYDPVSIREYYQLYAFFNNTPLEVEIVSPTASEFEGPILELPTAEHEAIEAKVAAAREREEQVRQRVLGDLPEWTRAEHERLAGEGQADAWRTVELERFHSAGGADHQMLDDGSILVGGERPDTDTYTLVAKTALDRVAAVRVQALTHPSLPGDGPGRHDPERPNFVLNQFAAAVVDAEGSDGDIDADALIGIDVDADETLRPLPLAHATASYANSGYPVAAAIDGKGDTGWAIHQQFGQPHEAIFEPPEPIELDEGGNRLVFTLDQNHGGTRTIGRLRLALSPVADPMPEAVAEALLLSGEERNDDHRRRLREYYLQTHRQVREAEAELEELERRREALGPPPSTLVMVEKDEPRTTRVFRRGNFLSPGEAVEPATPRVLHPMADGLPPDRLGLAKWLTDPANPLTARVTVNRWWGDFFGNALVRSEGDFGTQGDPPTHPDLLDYLATELIASGWSRKQLHRLIVTSATYRQSSRVASEMLARDPDNHWLGRSPRLRLPAETLRDNALAISGLLTRQLGGPPVYPPQPEGIWRHIGRNQPDYDTDDDARRYRRGVYVVWRRSAPYPSFVNFDAPDRAACTVSRGRTNTPLQALTLMNDRAYVEAAWAMARRVAAAEGPDDLSQRVRHAFRLALARQPREAEHAHLLEVYQRERELLADDPDRLAALLADEPDPPAGVEPSELAAWFFVASILLNLDETITRG